MTAGEHYPRPTEALTDEQVEIVRDVRAKTAVISNGLIGRGNIFAAYEAAIWLVQQINRQLENEDDDNGPEAA